MSKQKKKNEPKVETRTPSAAHVARIHTARAAALEAEARVGRTYIELMNLAGAASAANNEHHNAHAKAALSVGIDPTDPSGFAWDDARGTYTKKG